MGGITLDSQRQKWLPVTFCGAFWGINLALNVLLCFTDVGGRYCLGCHANWTASSLLTVLSESCFTPNTSTALQINYTFHLLPQHSATNVIALTTTNSWEHHPDHVKASWPPHEMEADQVFVGGFRLLGVLVIQLRPMTNRYKQHSIVTDSCVCSKQTLVVLESFMNLVQVWVRFFFFSLPILFFLAKQVQRVSHVHMSVLGVFAISYKLPILNWTFRGKNSWETYQHNTNFLQWQKLWKIHGRRSD